ncbi:MAG: HAMP domain-containing sensor histidine kinase [Anaerobutyricum sp.]|nr:HAMP domain-containing sensor histidine kinase [Anaerobutyricum sp.]
MQVKIMLYGIISVAIGLIFYMTIQFGGENYIERVYMSEDRAQKRMDRLVDKFSRFVYSEDVNSYDYEEIKEWCKKQDNAYLMIFNSDGELTFETDGTMSSVYPNGESDSTAGGSATYRISFEDGDYDIVMIEFSEYEYYDGVKVLGIIGALIGLVICLLAFSQTIIRKITFLSKEVWEVRNGNLQKTVSIRSNDEIGQLADDVNEMRLSIINHYEEAEKAWEANKELLTSISHDIRTPLTSLIGFSEMMDEETDVDLIKEYARICREKAYQLKNLTDQMFRYFLVYGNAEMELHLETYGARTFFEQFLGEYAASLSISGYQVDFKNLEEDFTLETDVALLRRVFDNIFSNIKKYADKKQVIDIWVTMEKESLIIVLENVIDECLDVSESTHIGVKICRKVMETLGGQYENEEITKENHRIYRSKITLTGCVK